MDVNAITDQINLTPGYLSDTALTMLSARLAPVKNWVVDAPGYIKKTGIDADVFSPLWGDTTQPLIAEALFACDKQLIEHIRLIWWFSGWPITIYTDLNTFPQLDPVYLRYQKLKAVTPDRFRYAAPAVLGEMGWREGNGVVNHDVAILQERMQFLYFSGVTSFLDENKQGMILEIGTGYGGMSLAFHKSFPEYRNVLTDIPQSLAVAYCYLNVALPDADHYAVTIDGIYHVNTGKQVIAEEAFNKPGAFIYLPNYLMPAYEAYLQANMVFNAMSLHEMPSKSIDYYCATIPTLLSKHQGVFCEFNTHVGLPNAVIDGRLKQSFKHELDIDYPSLACRLRVWSDSAKTLNKISTKNNETMNHYPIEDLFEFDCIKEWPLVSDEKIKEMLLDSLGKCITPLAHRSKQQPPVDGYSVPVFVVPDEGEPFMGNHLRYIVGRRISAGPAGLRQEMAKLNNTISELTIANRQKEQAILELKSSRSWRYTAYIRKMLEVGRSLLSFGST